MEKINDVRSDSTYLDDRSMSEDSLQTIQQEVRAGNTSDEEHEDKEHMTGDPIQDLLWLLAKAKGKLLLPSMYNYEEIYTPLVDFFQTRGTELNIKLETYADDSQPLFQLLSKMRGEFAPETWAIVIRVMADGASKAPAPDKPIFDFFATKQGTADLAQKKALFMMILISGKVSLETRQTLLVDLSTYLAKQELERAIVDAKARFAEEKEQTLRQLQDVAADARQAALDKLNAEQKQKLADLTKKAEDVSAATKKTLKEWIEKR